MMKKFIAIILSVIMTSVISMSVCAADNELVLTTTVPAATYTLSIPESQSIVYGDETTDIGYLRALDTTNFSTNKNLRVTINYANFTADNVNTEIPLTLSFSGYNPLDSSTLTKEITSGESVDFENWNGELTGGTGYYPIVHQNNDYFVMNALNVNITEEAWSKALAGNYSTTITFTTEVVIVE